MYESKPNIACADQLRCFKSRWYSNSLSYRKQGVRKANCPVWCQTLIKDVTRGHVCDIDKIYNRIFYVWNFCYSVIYVSTLQRPWNWEWGALSRVCLPARLYQMIIRRVLAVSCPTSARLDACLDITVHLAQRSTRYKFVNWCCFCYFIKTFTRPPLFFWKMTVLDKTTLLEIVVTVFQVLVTVHIKHSGTPLEYVQHQCSDWLWNTGGPSYEGPPLCRSGW